MKQFGACFASLAFSSLLYSQSLPNPSFESNGTFDMTGWNWFCSTPDFAAGEGHNGCCGLLLPTSDAPSPCFSTGQAIGVHSKIDDMEAGVPYTLTLWENMSGPDITSDVGMFAMPAGQVPSSFGSGVPLGVWPIGLGGPGGWLHDVIPFTIPAQYAGMDFYFFIEYSIAPDPIPGAKMFDDIAFIDLSTGIAEMNSPVANTCPVVTDVLRLGRTGPPVVVEIFGIDGRFVSSKLAAAGCIDVSELAYGTYVVRNGPRTQRFTKE